MTCFWGQKVAYQYQIRQLRYQQEFEIFKENLYGSMTLLDDISLAASERLMGMERVLWVINGTSKGDLDAIWDDYYKTVLDWNVKQLVFKTKLIQYIDDDALIEDLMDDNDSKLVLYQNVEPKSLHGHFLRAHRIIKKLYECARHNCSEKDKEFLMNSTQNEINNLGRAIEEYHNEFVKRVYSMAKVSKTDFFNKGNRF